MQFSVYKPATYVVDCMSVHQIASSGASKVVQQGPMPCCYGPLLLQRTLLPCLPVDEEDKSVRVSSIHDHMALSLLNIPPNGSIIQQGMEVQCAARTY